MSTSSERIPGGAFGKGSAASQTLAAASNSDHESSDNEAPRRLRDSKKNKKAQKNHIPPEIKQKASKYSRGHDSEATPVKARSKKAQAKLDHAKKRRDEAILEAARSEVLLTEQAGYLEADKMERTYKFTQKQLAEHVDISSANKIFDLHLEDFGPYMLDYTSNGKQLLIGGRKGHLATMDWRNGKLGCEIHLRETIRDVCWLHNQNMFAVAQKQYAYIYDHTGAEVHCLQKHKEPTRLGFLPYHFLLASTGMTGRLVYQDITEGKVIGEHKPGYGPAHVLQVNPFNAVVHMGHGNGVVTLWSPQQSTPLAKILCHKGPVQAMAIDHTGTYMATSGLDGRVKIWDIRNFKAMHEYTTLKPAHSLDISQRGLLAAGWGPNMTIWKDALSTNVTDPYMKRQLPGSTISDVQFVPYDDVLGYGHSLGISSIVVPGAGEPNFDAFVANPFQTRKQRQEAEVKMLLDKLAPDTIQLDPNFIGKLDPRNHLQRHHDKLQDTRSQYDQNKAEGKYKDSNVKNKTKGRNSTAKRYNRKRQSNVMDLKKLQDIEKLERELREKEAKRRKIPQEQQGALSKFYMEKH
ncbi:putative U3 small nucleolar RNA-associated protein 7 [Coemansia sp. RSA 989]|nr:WD40-repeat-containing domain protein [Coemansia mojavensis]KAJ1753098.1 putative U3 small nucleolar RNA-associated protein 7 [Coemansia sp. RSA 1821]KAJ1867983.1 putative U3 small nucleolar RNA-associated protein 7 [Coemansia sp. RSA 989]KAJ1875336.1 putative U3 small nucleolar RNA-associated protein 7 [Coemansia sp. RSA 990]